jgi:ferredoxin
MIESQEYKDDLIKLAKKLTYSRQSFAKDDKGEPTETYLEYLSLMYNPEIAKLILHLPVFPKMMSLVKFAREVNIDKKELAAKLEEAAKRGFIIKLGKSYSQPMPLFVYDLPFILKENYDREDVIKFAELSRKFYTDDKYYKTWQTSRKGVPRLRVLTVTEEIEPGHEIVPIEEVYSIIDRSNDFAVIPCPCRKRKDIEGIRECKYTVHNCIMLGANAKALEEFDDPVVKLPTKEEVKRIVREAGEEGLVHCTDNTAYNTMIICNCCECCCGMLRGLTEFDNPRAVAKANFISTIDQELCIGCETCVNRCKFGAITVNDVAEVNSDKCVGCGLCAVTCPEDAITMKRFEREEIPDM